MMRTTKIFCRTFAIATMALTVCAHADTNGGVIAGKDGLTFYTYDHDVAGSGKSACYEQCLERWPAVPAGAASGKEFGSLQRADGTHQITYHGQPVYYYRDDHKPGDALGDGKGGVWHALRSTAKPSVQSDYKTNTNYGY
jgi:predicted lipoprotein with Yx(FWY)xxD motif